MKKITTLFLVLVCSLFCMQTTFANELNTDQVYLFGNCKSSDLATASLFGMSDGQQHTFAGASLLDIEALKAKGTVVLGIRVYIGDAINTGRVFLGKDYQNPL